MTSCAAAILNYPSIRGFPGDRLFAVSNPAVCESWYSARSHWVGEADVKPGGDTLNSVGEKAVRHGGVEQHGHNATVEAIRVALIARITVELAHDATIRPAPKTQAGSAYCLVATNHTQRMAISCQSRGMIVSRRVDIHAACPFSITVSNSIILIVRPAHNPPLEQDVDHASVGQGTGE